MDSHLDKIWYYDSMKVPQDILDKIRDHTSLSSIISRKVSWDKKKTNPSKGDFWASCPFHTEKTASFHVNDAKGYYYCFGCHKKGDVITFRMESENLSFTDAVKTLAEEAGLTFTAIAGKEPPNYIKIIMEILRESKEFFKSRVYESKGHDVQNYLKSRNVDRKQIEEFEIGYAPQGSNILTSYLIDHGFSESSVIESGMTLKSEKNGKLFDRFQHRLMFPISDARGRTIAFGGRSLSSQQNAKYLNSPETPVFKKRMSIYNFPKARGKFSENSPLIVVEGYMDVISLSANGFESAVAPLGTAITKDQLEILWKISPEPIIMMDGDIAGLRAANKLLDTLLPIITFKNTARFCFLPKDNDPDDFLNTHGPEAFKQLLASSQSLSECIWKRETEERIFDSPERIVALDKRLSYLSNQISDQNLRRAYFSYFQKAKQAMLSNNSFKDFKSNSTSFHPSTRNSSKKVKILRNDFRPTKETRGSIIAKKNLKMLLGSDQLEQNLEELESFILAFIVFNKLFVDDILNKLSTTEFRNKSLRNLKEIFLTLKFDQEELIENDPNFIKVETQLKKLLSNFVEQPVQKKFYRGKIQELLEIVEELIEKQMRTKALIDEFQEAKDEIFGVTDESLTLRLKEAHQAFQIFSNKINSKYLNKNDDFNEKSNLLKKFIDDKIWKKT